MAKKIKEIGGLSKKAKFNIFIGIFIVFIIISALTSLSQITNIIRNREKVSELEEKLNYEREQNIKLLAEEKSLYQEEAIELEARKQFNMSKDDETNYFVELETTSQESQGGTSTESVAGSEDLKAGISDNYKQDDLWGNIRLLYENEIKE